MAFPAAASKSRNPFGQLTAIRNAEMFFGRENSLELLYNAFLDRQCVAITGSRRIGKSSLLTCCCLSEIQQRAGYDLSHHLLLLVDLEEHLQKTPDAFFSLVCDQLFQQGQKKLHLEMPSATGGEQFSQLLEQFQEQGLSPVLLLDEFDSIVHNPQFSPDFFAFLRALANKGRVSFVTASLLPLAEICHSEIVGSPFFNIFSHHDLGPFSEEAARTLITVPAKVAGRSFTEQEVRFVLHLAGRHPFYIQRTCYFLFQQKSRAEQKLNTRELANQLYQDLFPHFTYAWKHIRSDQQAQLRGEAIRKNVSQRKLPEFSESALFRKFVRDKAKMVTGELTMEYLRDVLDKLDDFTFLGESHLSNLNIIFSQEQIALTAVERGMQVYKVLEEALAKLQDASYSGSATLERQMYNILQHCYFKRDRRSNKQLASYLGMSERDFYRKRDDAVNALLNILLKMDAAYAESVEI